MHRLARCAALASLLLFGCDCASPPPLVGVEGAPCTTQSECNAGLVCSDGTCRRAGPDFDAGPGGDDSGPRPDTGPTCPAADRCGSGCCTAGEECVDRACLPVCDSGLRCGPSMACCGDGQLCIADACVTPGAACEEPIDCPVGEQCDATLSRCLPGTTGRCEYFPPPGIVAPVLQWRWPAEGEPAPASHHVMMTPVVGDLDGDEIPEVAFVTYASSGGYTGAGVLRVVRGDTGEEIFNVDTPAISGGSPVALGDLDGDRIPEILVVGPWGGAGNLHAFDNQGNHLWTSRDSTGAPVPMNIDFGGIAIADMDGDGRAEIIAATAVFEYDGTLRFSHGTSGRPTGAAYDLDGDGDLELVTAQGAWHHDGSVLWANPALPEGNIAIADFFADGQPDVVVVQGSIVTMYNGLDGTLIWGPVAQPGGTDRPGGPPTIADFDDDGLPEIGVAGQASYAVYDPDGDVDVLWTSTTEDDSSGRTGSSVFDFDGDGSAEVVYNDECYMRIYQGRDGSELARIDNSSHTLIEYPVIVDVDGDGNTEIVFAANGAVAACSRATQPDYTGFSGGIRVYRDGADNWVGTRRVWNQHAYSITHIREDLSMASPVTPNHQRFNNFRQNPQSFDAPDLQVASTSVETTGCPTSMVLRATVTNAGDVPVGPGLSVTFYVGEMGGTNRAVGTATTSAMLRPGGSEQVSITFEPTSAEVGVELPWFVVVDDTGAGVGEHNECLEDNNAAASIFECSGIG